MTETTTTYFEVLRNLTNETLEWEFADEELGRFLVPTNLAEGDGTGTEPVWLLDTTRSGLYVAKLNHQHVTTTAMTTTSPTMTSNGKIRYVRRRQSCEQPWLQVAYGGPCLDMTKSELTFKEISDGARLPTSCGLAGGLLADNDGNQSPVWTSREQW